MGSLHSTRWDTFLWGWLEQANPIQNYLTKRGQAKKAGIISTKDRRYRPSSKVLGIPGTASVLSRRPVAAANKRLRSDDLADRRDMFDTHQLLIEATVEIAQLIGIQPQLVEDSRM